MNRRESLLATLLAPFARWWQPTSVAAGADFAKGNDSTSVLFTGRPISFHTETRIQKCRMQTATGEWVDLDIAVPVCVVTIDSTDWEKVTSTVSVEGMF